jgi:hypothetical protein
MIFYLIIVDSSKNMEEILMDINEEQIILDSLAFARI